MLTTDENIVDIDFEVVWNISDPALFLFNLRDPEATIRAVSEASMREVISASQLAPILNRDRAIIAESVEVLIQQTLDSYDSGVRIVRLNLDRADPPEQVIDAFREVQAAEQERDRLERQADAYANRVLAGARGEAAQLLEEAEAYRAQVVNEAQGEASRFLAVLTEYEQAPEVTRRRLYLETMERVLGDVDLVILDGEGGSGGSGVVPYLPLNELRRGTDRHHNDDRELELMRRITFLIPALVLAIAVLLSSIFVVDERQKALVLQFGQIRQVIEEPGLNFKIPFIQEVVYYDDRILSLDTAAIEVTPSDDRRLVVDAFARYRIVRRGAVPAGGRRRRPAHRRGPAGTDHQPADPGGSGCRWRDVEHHPLVRACRPDAADHRAGPGRGAGAGSRGPRRAPEADQPAGAEPRGDLRPDARRTGTGSHRRDRPR
jgi:HflK protein